MKITHLIVLLGAIAVLGGCSSTPKYADADRTQQERMDAVTTGAKADASRKRAKAEDAWRKYDRSCRKDHREAVIFAKEEAVNNDKPASAWEDYYRIPQCMVIRKLLIQQQLDGKPIVLPSNLSMTVDEAANMNTDERCQKIVANAVTAKTIAGIIGDRSVEHIKARYDENRGACVIYNSIKELRSLRWSDFFYGVYDDRPGWRHRRGGIGVGIRFQESGYVRYDSADRLQEEAGWNNPPDARGFGGYQPRTEPARDFGPNGPTLNDMANWRM